MKKSFLSILVILIVFVSLAPFLNGLIMENILRSQLKKVNELYADYPLAPTFEINHYDRGFSRSEIKWTVTFAPQLDHGEAQSIVLIEKAKHGFTGASSTTSLNQNSWYNDLINDKLNGDDPLSITTDYSYFGGATATFSVLSFELHDDNNHFIIKPGELEINTTSDFDHLTARGHFDGLTVAGLLECQNISLDSDLEMITSLIMDGESSVSIEKLDIRNSDTSKTVEITDINATSTVEYNDRSNRLSTTTRYNIDQIVTNDETANDISISIGINQLDTDGLEKIQRVYADMLNDLMVNIGSMQNDPEQAQAVLEEQMTLAGIRLMVEVESLLKEDLNIEITDIHMSLPEGEISGDLFIGLKKDMTLASLASLSQQPEKVVEIFNFASNLSVTEQLIPDSEDLLTPLFSNMQSGVFVRVGDNLVHKAEIKDNKLLLNDLELVLN